MRAEFSLRPISVIIGKNGFGKSLLLNFLYLLSSTPPSFEELAKRAGDALNELVGESVAALKEGSADALSKALTSAVRLVFDAIGYALSVNLTKRFKEFFNVDDVNELFRGFVRVEAPDVSYIVKPGDKELSVIFENYEVLRVVAKRLKCARVVPGECWVEVEVVHGDKLLTQEPLVVEAEQGDSGTLVIDALLNVLRFIMLREFPPLWFGAGLERLFADSRAGVLRMARPAVVSSLQYGRLVVPAREATFLSTYSDVMAGVGEVPDELRGLLELFLAELGIRRPIVRVVGGYPEVLVEDVWGRVLYIEEAPSGVRESLCVAMALAANTNIPEALFVEEVESHLHPKALTRLVELAWAAASIRSRLGRPLFLIVTTHNPIVLSKLNNLIVRRGEYGLVSVLHLKSGEGGVVGEMLEVDENGFDESVLSDVFVELVEERGMTS